MAGYATGKCKATGLRPRGLRSDTFEQDSALAERDRHLRPVVHDSVATIFFDVFFEVGEIDKVGMMYTNEVVFLKKSFVFFEIPGGKNLLLPL